jgi:hypothetical protein
MIVLAEPRTIEVLYFPATHRTRGKTLHFNRDPLAARTENALKMGVSGDAINGQSCS